ncbi:MAG: 4Fe-4S dicluster domain-containing protein [Methanomassiliicoccales archaeon]|nr:4Fe-4S dicluster domain-containing protein [Methanomassiliicoccales archaeon]
MTSSGGFAAGSLEPLYAKIEEAAKQAGSDLVCFANLTPLKGILAGDATIFEFPTAVSFAVEIPKEAALASLKKPSEEMRSAYKMCNKKLKATGEKVVELLTAEGYKARFIDPAQRVVPEKLLGPISQKAIASLSGMGWIGKNGLLITDKFGARQRMGAVLTDMPVTRQIKLIDNQCGDCTACIDLCAMKVLKGPDFKHHPENRDLVIDWAKCGEYEVRLIGDGSKPEKACGRCISVCPFSKVVE